MKTIHKAAALVIEDNKFLVVKKVGKDIWVNLGGKLEPGESEEAALVREVKEEFGCEAEIMRKLGDFVAKKAAFDDAELKLSAYLVRLQGDITFVDGELEAYRFIGKDYAEEGIKLASSLSDHVIPFCINAGLLDW